MLPMLHDAKAAGLTISAIAHEMDLDRKTVRAALQETLDVLGDIT